MAGYDLIIYNEDSIVSVIDKMQKCNVGIRSPLESYYPVPCNNKGK